MLRDSKYNPCSIWAKIGHWQIFVQYFIQYADKVSYLGYSNRFWISFPIPNCSNSIFFASKDPPIGTLLSSADDTVLEANICTGNCQKKIKKTLALRGAPTPYEDCVIFQMSIHLVIFKNIQDRAMKQKPECSVGPKMNGWNLAVYFTTRHFQFSVLYVMFTKCCCCISMLAN